MLLITVLIALALPAWAQVPVTISEGTNMAAAASTRSE